MKKALIIIDMLNDFMRGGVLANESADVIIPPIQSMLSYARNQEDWVIVFSNDSHQKSDPEMSIWGPHAMEGTHGAKVIDALAPQIGLREWEEPKRFYGAFHGTTLVDKLRKHQVSKLYLTGQHTNCCVRHTAYEGFVHGFEIFVVADAVVPFNEDNALAIEYLKTIYGAQVTTSRSIAEVPTT